MKQINKQKHVYLSSPYDKKIMELMNLGLLVTDREKMRKDLANKDIISYLNYFAHDDRGGLYFRSVRWENVRRLYDFDERLRCLIFKSISRVETSFRMQFAYWMEQGFGRFGQYKEGMFKEPKGNRRSVYKDIQCWIKRYCLRWRCPFRDILDKIGWGKCYRIFSRLSPEAYGIKERIAREMGIPSVSIFSSVIFSLIELRNDCAHMRIVWNAQYEINPSLKLFPSGYRSRFHVPR